ncbi:MAG: phage terminase small subunit P27 family [Solirubrobacteraceae bacterium]
MAAKRPYEPSCPKGLSPYARSVWRRTINELKDRGELRPSDASAIERYVRAVEIARACWDDIDPARLRAKGSMGQPVTDPLVDSALKAEKHAADFAKALGIEPGARLEKSKGGRPRGTTKPRSVPPPTVTPLRAVK